MDPDIGEVIGSRQYRLINEDSTESAVSVLIGRPQITENATEYQCSFKLIGIGSQTTQIARGYDSIQALQSALILITAHLNHLNNELGRKLKWDGGRNGDLGFP